MRDFLVAWGLTWWSGALVWLLVGWLVAGALVWFRQPLTPARMIVCLLFWPGIVIGFLLGLLMAAAYWVFDPDRGPLAMIVALVRAASTPTALPPREAKPT